ncbi:MAG: murein biosynthesis integral membrane protein MurJ [Alphaproteobacteria bacterium]|jgi:putative peptidoglycan lipid II flippase|nr:murein biosynthesis integral membrane protein MurJ [Alphaproteobacteria bacterium]
MNLKNVAKVSGFTLLSRFLGLFRDILLSRYLGAGLLSDAFFVAFKIPNLFRRLFAEGSMQAAFVPIFAKLLGEDKEKAQEFASQVFTIFFIILAIFVVILEIFAPTVIMIISPGFKSRGDEIFYLTVDLLRITMPYLLFISMVAFYSSLLNSLNKFSLVAFLPAFLNLGIIATLFLSSMDSTIFKSVAHAGAWGIFWGGVAQLLCVMWACYKNNWLIRFSYIKKISQETKMFFKRIIPVIFGAGVYQVNIIIDVLVASLLPAGAISFLFYADRIYQLPLAIIGIAIGTVVLPEISRAKSEGEKNIIRQNSLVFSLGMSLFATIALILWSDEIIKIIFLGGNFNFEATQITALVLTIYALSLPFNILTKVILPFYYSYGDTKTPFYSTLVCLALNLVLVFALAHIMGVYGIALATVVASITNLLILFYFLRRKYGFRLSQEFFAELRKILAVSAILIVMMLLVKYALFDNLTISLFWFRFIFIFFVFAIVFTVIFLLKVLKSYIYFEIKKLFSRK